VGNILSFSLRVIESLVVSSQHFCFELDLIHKPVSNFLLDVALVLEGLLLSIHFQNLVLRHGIDLDFVDGIQVVQLGFFDVKSVLLFEHFTLLSLLVDRHLGVEVSLIHVTFLSDQGNLDIF
jgi:hypothetical protein